MEKEGKICSSSKCAAGQNLQPLENFSKNRANPDELEYHCKKCRADERAEKLKRIGREASAGNGLKRKTLQEPKQRRSSLPDAPVHISDAVTLDAQLLRAVKKSAILEWVRNDLPRLIEEALA